MGQLLILNKYRNLNGTFQKGHSFRIGVKHSEESKKKMGESLKGMIAWNKGKTNYLSDESRKKISNARKGKPSWNKGKKLSEDHIRKLSSSHLGFKRPQSGKEKISNTLRKMYRNGTRKSAMFGKKQSKETIQKRVSQFSGNKSHFWKGGVTLEIIKIRTSFEMKLFRRACMERDDYTDQKTGERGGKLQVHHIQNFADFPQLRTSISNGITLSKESHKKFHQIYGKRNNTREQLEEFLGKKI